MLNYFATEHGQVTEATCYEGGDFRIFPLAPSAINQYGQPVELRATIDNIDASNGMPIFHFEDYTGQLMATTTAMQINGTDVRISSSSLTSLPVGTYSVKAYNAPSPNSFNRPIGTSTITVQPMPPADLAVWRKTSGTWYVMGANNSIIQTQQQFGLTGDIPIQGDYDGDGKTDFATYRPAPDYNSNSQWWICYSSSNYSTYASFALHLRDDIPTVADFDGDGKTDAAVYRPSTGTWWFRRSSDMAVNAIQFGLGTDKPAPKDFDGDGKADVAFFRPSDGKFYAFRSSDGTVQIAYFPQTTANDIPVPADYDGDGKADFAVKRSGGGWIINRSSDNQMQTINWHSGDVEVPNDYDGDGKVDIAVWRRADGVWLIRQSSKAGQADELRAVQWGSSDDIPVPAFYRR